MTTSTPILKRRPFYWEKRKRVGNYLLEDPLGEGAFGRVRYGRHIPTNEKVAVKLITKKVLVKSEVSRKSLRREGNVLQRLDHPNIAKLYETMETKSCYYLIFELADGGSFLDFLIKKRYLVEDEARLALREIVSAVDHIHTSGFVHRDLRLENLLLDSGGHIKLTGFGLCMYQTESETRTTRCGSPAYAAPEVFCNRTHGTGVDIWSIGVCMFAMLIGHLPFLPRKLAKLPELHTAVLSGITIPGFLSTDCAELLSKMLKPLLSERIKMDEILRHTWLVKGFGNIVPRQPPFSKLAPTVVDSQLAQYISYVCGYSASEISEAIHERKCNHISATYHLLVNSIKSGFRIPDISELELSRHDSSDEFMYSTQTQIMQEYIESILTDHSARTDGIPPIHSIPLYKSCIKCLRESRCKLHGPDQRSKIPVGPMLKECDGSAEQDEHGSQENVNSAQEEVPEFVKQYLIDSNIKTVDDLISMTTDIESAIKLPEMILAYLCQGFNNGTLKDVELKDLMPTKNLPGESEKYKNVIQEEETNQYADDSESPKATLDTTTDMDNDAKEGDRIDSSSEVKNEANALTSDNISSPEHFDAASKPVQKPNEKDIEDSLHTNQDFRTVPKLELVQDFHDGPTNKGSSNKQDHVKIITHRSSNNEERIVLENDDQTLGLRDPYAEEIWISMYPKTIKLRTTVDHSPRRPVLFNPSLSSPKLLTLRKSHPSNTTFNFYRQMVASNKFSANSDIDLSYAGLNGHLNQKIDIMLPTASAIEDPTNNLKVNPVMTTSELKQK